MNQNLVHLDWNFYLDLGFNMEVKNMMNRRDFLKAAGAALASCALSACAGTTTLPDFYNHLSENLSILESKITAPGSKIIAYSPTNYNPMTGSFPSEDSIRNDLETLANHGFNGVITYGCSGSLASIPRIAAETGFLTIITGVWNPNDNQELNNAIDSKEYSHGFCIGNEQLSIAYSMDNLESAISSIKLCTEKPTTTTQQTSWYSDSAMVNVSDFMLPTEHPWWANIRQPAAAADFLIQKYNDMKALANGKLVLMKEAGLPTAGDLEASEQYQKDFFNELALRKSAGEIYFASFEAFDQPWKNFQPVEPYWGVCKSDRSPKLVLQ